MGEILEWARTYESVLWALAGGSLLMLVASIVAVPMIVVRLPHDYFAGERRPWRSSMSYHPLLRLVLAIARNVLGLALILAGLLMLILPGQGVVAILVGLTLMSFPGKYHLERWIVARQPVRRAFNWLRRRAGRRALLIERPHRTQRRPDSP